MPTRRRARRPRRNGRVKSSGYNKAKYRRFRSKFRARLGGRRMGMVSNPFPAKTFTTLTYTASKYMTAGVAGTVANQQYCFNDIYDPDYTGAGQQPKYYDTLLGATGGAAPYRTFKVHAAKIKVTFFSYTGSTVSDVVAYVGLQTTTGTSMVPQDMEDIMTTPYITSRAQGQTQNSRPITLKKFIKVKKLYGISYLDDDKYSGSYNASPSTRGLFNVGFLSVDSTAVGQMNITVQIKYFVELSAMNMVADS